tara:strand:- start:2429 stop:2677 length:249 start_codon:yes stop_codon:yes gene_type:complete
MRSYLKYIIYFALSVADSFINFTSSVFRVYPGSDMSGSYLARRELKKTLKWDINHQMLRQSKAQSALEKMDKARRDSDGQDT